MKKSLLDLSHFLYCHVIKPILFLFDAEAVHNSVTSVGQALGKVTPLCRLAKKVTSSKNLCLTQTVSGIEFNNPVGLAAGFDYEAKLTQVLPLVGFGFGTVGTITNKPYEGNIKPRLGRLIKSRSLLVNKGFKNLGINKTVEKLKKLNPSVPMGLSIGVTNTPDLLTQEDAVRDIVEAFSIAKNSLVPFNYYELNISCPNLKVKVEFYSPSHLDRLLAEISRINLGKPLFVKMPIDKNDNEVLDMLEVIVQNRVQGVIFGNLQKDKFDSSIDPRDRDRFVFGNFSGKPTEKRSNELIALTYRKYREHLTIIGCGGIFCAEDAYKKIKLGASLVQLVTGMIYEGPQLIGQIKMGLAELLERDGFENLTLAVGSGES